MENIINEIRNCLIWNGHKIIERGDILKVITVLYQINYIHICPKDKENFVSMILTGIDEINQDNDSVVMRRCLEVGRAQNVVKAYLASEKEVILAYEFYFKTIEDLALQIEKGLEALVGAKVYYTQISEE